MLTIAVRLLTGRYVATRFNDRAQVEWPPHPGRLFSAAVAAWADADQPQAERGALEWWEGLVAPDISCSWGEGCSERAPVIHYVPVNDVQIVARHTDEAYRKLRELVDGGHKPGPPAAPDTVVTPAERRQRRAWAKLQDKTARDSQTVASSGKAPPGSLGILPESRARQARVYPTVIPEDDTVYYTWTDTADTAPDVEVLDRVLARIARLGHSSSMVSVAVVDKSTDPTLVADENGPISLRVASAGQVESLERQYARHQGIEPRSLAMRMQRYRIAGGGTAGIPTSVFGRDWGLLGFAPSSERRKAARYSIVDSLALARGVRGALMRSSAVQPPPEVISGHVPDSTESTRRSHLAIAPLPFVAHPHATGLVQAIGLVIPDSIGPEERRLVWEAVSLWLERDHGRLYGVNLGVSSLKVIDASVSAQPSRWAKPSRRWASVTPVALDRNPGNLYDRDPVRRDKATAKAAETIRSACADIGLPEPESVVISSDPLVKGSAPVRRFPPYAVQGGRLVRVLTHARLEFATPVEGPVILGAGRYLGYGLCTPLPEVSGEGVR